MASDATAHELRVAVGRLRRRFRDVTDNESLTPTQVSVLSRLSKTGEASASELAAAERVRPQSMATTLGVLVDRGLVERRPDPDDGRRQIISLAAPGKEFIEGTRRTGEEWLATTIDSALSPEERRVLAQAAQLMQRIADL